MYRWEQLFGSPRIFFTGGRGKVRIWSRDGLGTIQRNGPGGENTVTRDRKRLRRTVFGWGPAVLWAGVLFLLSAWDDPSGLPEVEHLDKVLHIAIYTVLGAALWWARHHRHPEAGALWFGALGFLYGVSDEWHQTFVAGRDAAFGDVIADGIGVLLGLGALMIIERRSSHGSERTNVWSEPR